MFIRQSWQPYEGAFEFTPSHRMIVRHPRCKTAFRSLSVVMIAFTACLYIYLHTRQLPLLPVSWLTCMTAAFNALLLTYMHDRCLHCLFIDLHVWQLPLLPEWWPTNMTAVFLPDCWLTCMTVASFTAWLLTYMYDSYLHSCRTALWHLCSMSAPVLELLYWR